MRDAVLMYAQWIELKLGSFENFISFVYCTNFRR